jgi:hypothetical protein
MKDRPVDSRILIAEDPPSKAIDKGTEADPADGRICGHVPADRGVVR